MFLVPDNAELKVGKQVAEGKTKLVFELDSHKDWYLIESKDKITAGNNERQHDLEGKAVISTATTSMIFQLLEDAGDNLVKSDVSTTYNNTSLIY